MKLYVHKITILLITILLATRCIISTTNKNNNSNSNHVKITNSNTSKITNTNSTNKINYSQIKDVSKNLFERIEIHSLQYSKNFEELGILNKLDGIDSSNKAIKSRKLHYINFSNRVLKLIREYDSKTSIIPYENMILYKPEGLLFTLGKNEEKDENDYSTIVGINHNNYYSDKLTNTNLFLFKIENYINSKSINVGNCYFLLVNNEIDFTSESYDLELYVFLFKDVVERKRFKELFNTQIFEFFTAKTPNKGLLESNNEYVLKNTKLFDINDMPIYYNIIEEKSKKVLYESSSINILNVSDFSKGLLSILSNDILIKTKLNSNDKENSLINKLVNARFKSVYGETKESINMKRGTKSNTELSVIKKIRYSSIPNCIVYFNNNHCVEIRSIENIKNKQPKYFKTILCIDKERTYNSNNTKYGDIKGNNIRILLQFYLKHKFNSKCNENITNIVKSLKDRVNAKAQTKNKGSQVQKACISDKSTSSISSDKCFNSFKSISSTFPNYNEQFLFDSILSQTSFQKKAICSNLNATSNISYYNQLTDLNSAITSYGTKFTSYLSKNDYNYDNEEKEIDLEKSNNNEDFSQTYNIEVNDVIEYCENEFVYNYNECICKHFPLSITCQNNYCSNHNFDYECKKYNCLKTSDYDSTYNNKTARSPNNNNYNNIDPNVNAENLNSSLSSNLLSTLPNNLKNIPTTVLRQIYDPCICKTQPSSLGCKCRNNPLNLECICFKYPTLDICSEGYCRNNSSDLICQCENNPFKEMCSQNYCIKNPSVCEPYLNPLFNDKQEEFGELIGGNADNKNNDDNNNEDDVEISINKTIDEEISNSSIDNKCDARDIFCICSKMDDYFSCICAVYPDSIFCDNFNNNNYLYIPGFNNDVNKNNISKANYCSSSEYKNTYQCNPYQNCLNKTKTINGIKLPYSKKDNCYCKHNLNELECLCLLNPFSKPCFCNKYPESKLCVSELCSLNNEFKKTLFCCCDASSEKQCSPKFCKNNPDSIDCLIANNPFDDKYKCLVFSNSSDCDDKSIKDQYNHFISRIGKSIDNEGIGNVIGLYEKMLKINSGLSNIDNEI